MIIVQATVDGYLTYHEKMSFLFSTSGVQRVAEFTLFMDVFSIIFDLKYNENFNFTELICETVENPYVEVVLDQQERIIWENTQTVTIKRYLKEPACIFVNNVSMDFDEFHETIASFGYFQFSGICLHRMDQPTINKLKHVNGHTLWNMVNEFLKSEDLLRLIETKEHMHKNLMLHKDMKNDMEEMNKQLPYRLQQKDDTKKHFALSKKLKTLYKIISERESKIIVRKNTELDIEKEQKKLKMEKHRQFLRKTYNTKMETLAHNKSAKKITDVIEYLTENAESVKQDHTEYFSFVPFEDVYHRYVDLETSSDEVITKIEAMMLPYLQFLEHCFREDSTCTVNRIKRQLILTKHLPSHQNIVHQIYQKVEDIAKEQYELKAELEDITKKVEIDKILIKQHRLDHHVAAGEVVGNVLKFHNDSFDLQKKIFSAKKEIFKCIKEKAAAKEVIVRCEISCNIYPRLAKTLFDIECFINDPITGSEFKDDYYGPLFSYLQPKDFIERDLWHELVPLMSVFMFGKVSTARAFHLALSNSKNNYEGYSLMGMDNFFTRPYQEIPHDLTQKVNSASEIVKINIRFHHILFRLLHGSIRVNDKLLDIEQLFRTKVAVVSEDTLSIAYWNSLVSVGWYKNAAVGLEDSPLEHLHTLYKYIGNFLKEESKLRNIKYELEVMKNKLKELHCYKHRVNYVILHRAKDKFHLLMEKELKIKEDLIRNNEEIKCYEKLKSELISIDYWNLDELTASCLKIDLSKMYVKNEMKCEIDEEFAKLHDINLVISMHNNEMERWMSKTLDHWNQWNVATISDHKDYLVNCQELNNDYFDMILANIFQEMDNWNSKCVDSNSTHEHSSKIKLIEVQGMLTKIHYDMTFLKSEILASDNISTDVLANDTTTYIAYKEANLEYVIQAIDALQKEIKDCPEPLSREQYVDLRETIQDIVKFSTIPKHQVVAQNTVTPKAFPYVNRLVVKMLKDTLIGYELTYKYIMSKFIRKGTLYCYDDRKNASAMGDEQFNWQYFDLSRFQSIDFKTVWIDNNREVVGDEVHTAIKAFLLNLHLIRYVSHFKFIIIDEKFYDMMDSRLVDKIKHILEMISEYVQIFMIGP